MYQPHKCSMGSMGSTEQTYVKTWMRSTKRTFHKERNFTSNYFIFLKKLEPLIKSWFDVPTTEMFIFIRWSFIWECFFPVSILKYTLFLQEYFKFCRAIPYILKRGTSWNKLERATTSWNELETFRTSWN